ncbi:hypothetical protein N7540_002352 [Penicillium herquei]|nr:hypothetical protein N7540_002352 [Penicillium herquei]
MSKPVFVILGATGNQGGSVVSRFLSSSAYSLRVVTRNPFSPKALALATQGVEVVSGDFDDPSSLDVALKDASLIFSMTDFWGLMTNETLREKAAASGTTPGFYIRDYEAQQNRNIIDAAARVETLERFIFSSLPNVTELSAGKYRHAYHFDSKSMAEEYGKSTYPGLWAKTSVLYAALYLENFLGESRALFCPKLVIFLT